MLEEADHHDRTLDPSTTLFSSPIWLKTLLSALASGQANVRGVARRLKALSIATSLIATTSASISRALSAATALFNHRATWFKLPPIRASSSTSAGSTRGIGLRRLASVKPSASRMRADMLTPAACALQRSRNFSASEQRKMTSSVRLDFSSVGVERGGLPPLPRPVYDTGSLALFGALTDMTNGFLEVSVNTNIDISGGRSCWPNFPAEASKGFLNSCRIKRDAGRYAPSAKVRGHKVDIGHGATVMAQFFSRNLPPT